MPPPILSRFGTHTLAKGTTLHRFCAISRRPNVFNPCMGDATRFAPLYTQGPARVCIPTLYIGESYDAAAFETIFRNLPPIPLARQIRESDLHERAHARLELRRNLTLGPFFHQNVSLIGQTRQSMIDTDATCYMETVQWAAAVHASFPRLDGLIWTSHQHDRDFACVLFGDRVKRTDLHLVAPIERVDIGPGRARIGVFCKNYKIDILPP